MIPSLRGRLPSDWGDSDRQLSEAAGCGWIIVLAAVFWIVVIVVAYRSFQ